MAQTRVIVLNETKKPGKNGEYILCFQYCRYEFQKGNEQNGYRFIWQSPKGNLLASRGQARIPSVADILFLTSQAIYEGWGNHICNYVEESDENL